MTKRTAAKPTNHQVGEQVKQHHIALLLDIHANGLTDANRIELDTVASIYVDGGNCDGDSVPEAGHD